MRAVARSMALPPFPNCNGVSAVMLAIVLSACGGGTSSAGPAVTVVPAGTSSPVPVPAPTPTPTPTSTPTPTPTPTSSPEPAPTGTATPSGTRSSLVLSEGDSISVFWGGNHTGIYAASHPKVAFVGKAVGGSRIMDSTGNGLVQRAAADLALKPGYVTILIGANDLGDGNYTSAEDWLTALWSYVATVRATGAKVAVGTVLPICMPKFTQYTTTHNMRRAIVNPEIRRAVGSRIDAVIDFAADPDLGPDNAACNTNWYGDGLHPTDGSAAFTGGQGRMAKIYGEALDTFIK